MGNDRLRLTMLPARCSSTPMPYYVDGSLLAQERPDCRSFSRNVVQPVPRLCSARIDRLSLLGMGGGDSQPGVQLLLARSTRHGEMGDAVVRRRRFGSRLRELNLMPCLNVARLLTRPHQVFAFCHYGLLYSAIFNGLGASTALLQNLELQSASVVRVGPVHLRDRARAWSRPIARR